FVTSAGLAENVLMVKSVKKEIGAVCAELGGLLEKPRAPVNVSVRKLYQ
ncbi:MAG: hypothetical protein V7632_2002, partial [Bradyrhizobium sp.]